MKADPLSSEEFMRVKQRSARAWSDRAPWDAIYRDAYDYAVPQRRPKASEQRNRVEKLYDMTAPMAAMNFAGNLQRDLFPPGQEPFTIEPTTLLNQAVMQQFGTVGRDRLERELHSSSQMMHPFFMSGDWDTSVHECCVDLAMGTGALLPIQGPPSDPLQFAALPFDQIAILVDGRGKMTLCSWKQEMDCDQIYHNWPNANWPEDFKDLRKSKPNHEMELYQVFWKDPAPGGGWHFCAYAHNFEREIIHERYRTQPISVPRYYRIPGEAYGRGVVLTALPSIKTLNKAQELALKSAAIQMLGIWAYRSNGTFNPNTARMGPGEFWAMQSTGGVLGPDVQRLDTASGSLNVAQLVIGNLQDQVKAAMFDTRLPDYQGTPRAASEIAARLRQKADVHIGAFGRLVHEIMPVIVPRAAEILADMSILQSAIPIDQLLYAVRVRSPMQAALNADRLAAIANYFEMVSAIAGPNNAPLYVDIDKTLTKIGEGLQIDKTLIPDTEKRAEIEAKMREQQRQQLEMMMAAEAAKAAPKVIADAATAEAQA